MLKFVSNFFKSETKQTRRKSRSFQKNDARTKIVKAASTLMPEDGIAGKGLFWGRYPHYPEMGTVYRSLLQRLKIDNQRSIKVLNPACGTDMCTIAGGSGPLIDYICDDEIATLIDKNVTKMGLGSKIDRVLKSNASAANRQYSAHIMSFYPKVVDDAALDWDFLGDTTIPGGYVIIPKIIEGTGNFKKPKPSEKISDNNEFYFYNMIDHTDHWKAEIEKRFLSIQNSDPENFNNVSRPVISAFKKEVTECVLMLQKLKTHNTKIMSVIYRHDDIE